MAGYGHTQVVCELETRIVANTRQGRETSRKIRFMKGRAQADALCPRLFTLYLNPVAWRLRVTDGYQLSKPIGVKVTDLLYIDDLKVFCFLREQAEPSAEGD